MPYAAVNAAVAATNCTTLGRRGERSALVVSCTVDTVEVAGMLLAGE